MTKHRKPEERRTQILFAAKECFIRNGYAHTRVDDIAEEAGLSKGGIYFHFKSKREIFDALHEQQQERNLAILEAFSAGEGTVAEQLTQLAQMMIQGFASGDERRKFLIVLGEMGIRDDEVRATVKRNHERYVDLLRQVIERGVERGELREIDPKQTGLFLKLLIDGIEQGIALDFDLDVGAFLGTGLQILLDGMRAP